MQWKEISLTIKRDALELATAVLYELGIEGFQIDDNTLTEADKEAMYVGLVDESILNTTDDITIHCYFNDVDDVEAKKEEILRHFKTFSIEASSVDVTVTDEEDWAHKWKEHFKTFTLGDHMVVKPLWETYDAKEDDVVIVIDPGMAFGSGTHETTSMCIKAVEALDHIPASVLDVGCGSGILGIAAAKLGAEKVTGIDIDVNAVKIARENCVHNGVEGQLNILHGDLLEEVTEQYDLVFANILAEVVIMITPDVKQVIKAGGLFISSGIIKEMKSSVLEALSNEGFEQLEVMEEGEWVTIVSRMGA